MRKRPELFGVENTDEFKKLVTQNLTKVYYSLQKRAVFLELCKNVLLKNVGSDSKSVDRVGEIVDKIIVTMMPALREAEQDFVALSLYVAKRIGIEDFELELDASVKPLNDKLFVDLRGREFKEALKSARLEVDSVSRRVVKEAQEIFEARKLKGNKETEDDYYQSLNFQYICGVNNIYSKTAGYGKVAEETTDYILTLKDQQQEK